MNLLDMVKGQLTDSVLQKLGSSVGLGTGEVSKAMDTIIPTQLSSVIQMGSNPTGAQNLMNLASNFSNFGNIAGVLNQADGMQNLLKMGQTLLPSLFGNKLGDVVQAVASSTGVGGKATNSLMTMIAPVIMGVLGNQIKTQGLNPMGLVNMLGSLKGPIGNMLPAGLGKLLDLGGLGAMAGQVGQAASSTLGQAAQGASNVAGRVAQAAPVVTSSRRGGLAWWIPALALLLLGGAAWLFTRPQTTPAATPTTTTTTTTDTTNSTATTDSSLSTSTATQNAACTSAFSLTVQDGATVTEGFRFGGAGAGQGYNITIKRADGRLIGTKNLPLDASCNWGYDSRPGKGKITYEVRPSDAAANSTPTSTVTLNVQ